jgi:hypothetical protein
MLEDIEVADLWSFDKEENRDPAKNKFSLLMDAREDKDADIE